MSERDASPSFLGTGWSFPPGFAAGGAAVDMVSDAQDVHQSLHILLVTRQGERPMQESFGASLDAVLFEEIDHALVNRITSSIHDAVLTHEPRVDVRKIDVFARPDDQGVLEIRLEYSVRGTNSRFNMVFPFYVNEASVPGA